jgi:hypothetical protein
VNRWQNELKEKLAQAQMAQKKFRRAEVDLGELLD